MTSWAAYDPTAVGTRLGGSLRRPAAPRPHPDNSPARSYPRDPARLKHFPAPAADIRAQMTAKG